MCHEDTFDQECYNAIHCRYEYCETGMEEEIVKNALTSYSTWPYY